MESEGGGAVGGADLQRQDPGGERAHVVFLVLACVCGGEGWMMVVSGWGSGGGGGGGGTGRAAL